MGNQCFKVNAEDFQQFAQESFFDLKANDITGKRIDFYIYKNKKAILIVNVASKSPLTKSNYQGLNQLYDQFRQEGLQILAFPCNQFGHCQPQNNQEIHSYTSQAFIIKFNLFEKIQVNGLNTHPVYRFLRSNSQLFDKKIGQSKAIPSNFCIFLVNREGKVARYFQPSKDLGEVKKSIKRILRNTNDQENVQY